MSLTKYLLAAVFAGAALPAVAAPDNYTIDPMHTYPSLEFAHMGLISPKDLSMFSFAEDAPQAWAAIKAAHAVPIVAER